MFSLAVSTGDEIVKLEDKPDLSAAGILPDHFLLVIDGDAVYDDAARGG